jgi:hypothetical protein
MIFKVVIIGSSRRTVGLSWSPRGARALAATAQASLGHNEQILITNTLTGNPAHHDRFYSTSPRGRFC